jgi:hypothetical protein
MSMSMREVHVKNLQNEMDARTGRKILGGMYPQNYDSNQRLSSDALKNKFRKDSTDYLKKDKTPLEDYLKGSQF